MKSLPFIAHRLREHGFDAMVWCRVVVAYRRGQGIHFLSDWQDARRLLGYA